MLMKKLLIATDFSPPAQKLLNCIDEFRTMGLEEIVLVHVVDIRLGEGLSISLKQEAEERLKQVEDTLKNKGFRTKLFTPIGFAASEIVNIARQEEVSLILIGSKGKGVIKEVFLGSTTFDVIRLAETPVLIEKYIKNEEDQYVNVCISKFDRVLLPIDFSDCSELIIERAKALSGTTKEIVLLTVVEQGESQQEIEASKQEYQRLMAEIAQPLEKLGITVKVRIEEGTPSQKIVATAEAEEVGSILMGTRGRGIIKALLLGSTSDAVARISKRPVLLIPCGMDEKIL